MNKQKCHIHTMEYYSVKKNEVLIYPATWIIENMISERSQILKMTYCIIPFVQNIPNR